MPRQHPPLIAVNGLKIHEPRPGLRLDERYAEAVLAAGGIPLAVPPVGGPGDVRELLLRVDGLLLTGGDDFETESLGLGPTHPAAEVTPPEKQAFDLLLTRTALDLGVPVLGICYGMQLLGLNGGSGLLQHLPEDRPGGQPHAAGVQHAVRIEPGSKLGSLTGVERLDVISRHHQALTDVRAPWKVSAMDEEGLVEAIEDPSRPFALGVQWHPELSPAGSPHARLFQGLVSAAGLRTSTLTHART